MSNAKSQHELVGVLINKYPSLVLRLANVAMERYPEFDHIAAAPNSHQVRKEGRRGQITTDATVRLSKEGKTAYFFQVETQREYSWSKLTTLRAYHGSEVRNTGCGGHLLVLSPDERVADRFRDEEENARGQLAFSVSYLSGRDLRPMTAATAQFPDRDLAAALTDFADGIREDTIPMVMEMGEHDETMADLFFSAILEGCADQRKLEEALSDLAMQRLQALPSFQRWLEKVTAQANERAGEEAEMRAQEAEKRAEEATTRAEEAATRAEEQAAAATAGAAAAAAAAAAGGEARGVIQSLLAYFSARGDAPTLSAMTTIDACTNPVTAQYWLRRAYAGETAAEIFPETDVNDS